MMKNIVNTLAVYSSAFAFNSCSCRDPGIVKRERLRQSQVSFGHTYNLAHYVVCETPRNMSEFHTVSYVHLIFPNSLSIFLAVMSFFPCCLNS